MTDRTTLTAIAEETETVRLRLDDPVDQAATIELHRPDVRNALNAQLKEELAELATTADRVDDLRVLVLTGSAASGAFAAGADIEELQGTGLVAHRMESRRPRIYDVVAGLSTPIVARVNGHAVGGGCELALACDVRVAAEGAKLGLPEINLGIIPAGGGTQRLPRLVGLGTAARLVLTGELIDAEEAQEIGLVDDVRAPPALDDAVTDLVGSIADKSPIALEVAKQALLASVDYPLAQGLQYESALALQLFATADKEEGVSAFLEDRDPEWQGR